MRPTSIVPLLLSLSSSAFAGSSAPLPAGAVTVPVDIVAPDDAPEGSFLDPFQIAPPIGLPSQVPYIVNGVEAQEDEYPEVVFLEMQNPAGGGTCSGSLIDPEWVLTAAHCIEEGERATAITVNFGSIGNTPTNHVAASEWFTHPDWKWDAPENGNRFAGDVGLIHLAEPVTDVFPMHLNKDPMDASWVHLPLTFIGFGITKGGGNDSGTKRYVEIPINDVPSSQPYLVHTYDKSHNICQGDSGGSGVLKTDEGYAQVTVTSHGDAGCHGTDGHMRVDNYLPWIRQVVETEHGGHILTGAASPPSFACARQNDPDDPLSRSIGIIPFDLACTLKYRKLDELTKVTWSWGDGSRDVVEEPGRHVNHTYTTAGTFTIQLCAEGQRGTGDDIEMFEHCVSRSDVVQACGPAEVAFKVEQDDGLTYKFQNYTSLRTSYGCIFNVQWDVYAGPEVTGEPIESIVSWEPFYTFDEPGEYTVVLNVGGIAGTAAAKATFDARPTGGTKSRCDQTSLPAGVLLGLAGLAALRRRKSS